MCLSSVDKSVWLYAQDYANKFSRGQPLHRLVGIINICFFHSILLLIRALHCTAHTVPVGLNGLQLFDARGEQIAIQEDQLHATPYRRVCAFGGVLYCGVV